jgi:AcrR family transcriptional regulator
MEMDKARMAAAVTAVGREDGTGSGGAGAGSGVGSCSVSGSVSGGANPGSGGSISDPTSGSSQADSGSGAANSRSTGTDSGPAGAAGTSDPAGLAGSAAPAGAADPAGAPGPAGPAGLAGSADANFGAASPATPVTPAGMASATGAVSAAGPRPQRADARRNRDRLLEVAVEAFTRDGLEATLDAIAKDAGVGIGTLYRHFPTRESLVEAAYRNELTKLCESADELLESQPADQAVREWMNRFTDYLSAKRGMADVLRALIASGGDPYAHSRDRLLEAIGLLLSAGAEAGTVRSDVEPGDVLASLSGVALASGQPDQREQAGRLLDLLMDGLRFGSSEARSRRSGE